MVYLKVRMTICALYLLSIILPLLVGNSFFLL